MKRLKRDLLLLVKYTGRALEHAFDALIARSNRRERE